ncbi:insulinase family protein [Collinsella sp. AGMB00827]|uniref:Insulinase family protein n=1 Tax=Collinsella ureilytica TaxID=2869515 RepID=A0ABS7MJH9_9ACTN|nr:insulinase family protein [Collinsella urealyticum]MBY4797241.1 insulinase family protein [Collinsella urealyticum]
MSTAIDSAVEARERAAKILQKNMHNNEPIAGFMIERSEEVPEFDADAYVLRHKASGARLLYLACDDENKAFAIAFKTPPSDSTGVFHILEHSVLCGSAKFPVKEPFVDLIKSSMQTFLNAMTYPDKTVYPVASTNEQDLLNLMDVYMDAVLNPAIYSKPAIFEQEGWHLEVDAPEGGSVSDEGSVLRYNGVVYNEMKGALSDPMSVLDGAVMAALFPDTAYAHESGGDPLHIPELTYEQFLDTHRRHYALSNSYITLYGDLNVERALKFLDEHYLCDRARERDAEARRLAAPVASLPGTAEHAGPNLLEQQAPVICEYNRQEMQTAPENAMVGLSYVLGGSGALDRKRVIGAGVMFDALFGSNEAPVKKAILAAGLGGNVVSGVQTAYLQPVASIILMNADSDVAHDLRRVVEQECARLVQEGIPRDRLEAVLSSSEFDLRQRDFGMADGVVVACEALNTWLYDDAAATSALQYGPIFAELRQELETSYFENLLKELVCESKHFALVELVPTEDAGSAASIAHELSERKSALDGEDLAALAARVEELRRIQETEDSPEARATLPRLHVSDIGAAPAEPPVTYDETSPLPCLMHDIPTHRLAYMKAYFDLSHLSFTELAYAVVLARLMKQLGTAERSAADLDTLITSELGFLSFSTTVLRQGDWRLARPILQVSAGALSEKLEALAEIPHEVWARTVFSDEGRIRDVLTQMKISMEQSFINAGHQAALLRAMSYVSPAAVATDQMEGVGFYRFLRELIEHFDERKAELIERLVDLQQRIFTSTDLVMSFTGSDEDYQRFWRVAGNLGLAPRTAAAKELMVPLPEPRHEAFIIPSDVCFAARATDPRALHIATDGTWQVASQALTFDYLWNEIRVKGGAYGCGFKTSVDRRIACYTYRDPAIDPSQERIDRAATWLSSFEPAPEEFEGLIVSCVAALDAPVKPYGLAARQDIEFLERRSASWRAEVRDQVLATTPERVRELAGDLDRALAAAPLCVFGGKEIIEASNLDLVPVDLFG